MKDEAHHIRHIQKKILRSQRKDILNGVPKVENPYLSLNKPKKAKI